MTAATHVVAISAGVGPLEARRFVRLLGARVEALCAAAGLAVLEIASHDADGEPRSVELYVVGDAPRALAAELGTHALVAPSERRGRAARKRWFARIVVEAAPPPAPAPGSLDPRELEITATTAGGPGGQHVNKVATAVRVRHLPSGLSVRVADERSQRANVRRALERIGDLLAARELAARRACGSALRAEKHRVERGGAVRTYRLGRRGELEITAENAIESRRARGG
jgi:protein subunit release factor B